MNQQEIFDTVAKILMSPTPEQLADIRARVVAGDLGLKAVVGSAIPADQYTLDAAPLMVSLKLLHDTMSPRYWKDGLARIARENNLTFVGA